MFTYQSLHTGAFCTILGSQSKVLTCSWTTDWGDCVTGKCFEGMSDICNTAETSVIQKNGKERWFKKEKSEDEKLILKHGLVRLFLWQIDRNSVWPVNEEFKMNLHYLLLKDGLKVSIAWMYLLLILNYSSHHALPNKSAFVFNLFSTLTIRL